MTLCIAAACTHDKRPAIVLCSDWRSETGELAGGDVEDKLSWIIPKRLAALKAGPIADADKMTGVFRAVFQELQDPPTIDNIREILDFALQRHRWMLIDDFLSSRLGINYAALVGGIKTKDPDIPYVPFPDSFTEEKLHEVEKLPTPNCLLTIAGFIESKPLICVVNEPSDGYSYSRTRFETNFAAIGSGTPAALISLYRREHTAADVPLMKSIYNVYEAKLIGEVSPGVGESTSISVLFPNGDCWDLTQRGHAYLEERFDYFGPIRYGRKRSRLKAPFFEFNKKYFEPYLC